MGGEPDLQLLNDEGQFLLILVLDASLFGIVCLTEGLSLHSRLMERALRLKQRHLALLQLVCRFLCRDTLFDALVITGICQSPQL